MSSIFTKVDLSTYLLSISENFFICMLFVLLLLCTLLSKSIILKVVFSSLLQTTAFFSFIHGSYTSKWKTAFIDNCNAADCLRIIDPLPHVFILTGIVVSLSCLGLGLFISARIAILYKYSSSEEIENYISKRERYVA